LRQEEEMPKDTQIINILTYKLPYDLARQIYNEYNERLKEANFLICNYKSYQSLNQDIKTVELLLSLSIFHRRVISNLDGALKFYNTVTKNHLTDTIRIGNYNLTYEESNKIKAIVIGYNKLLKVFSIPPNLMEYYDTSEFLKNIINFKSYLHSEKKNEKNK
jgi:hypothetical protein